MKKLAVNSPRDTVPTNLRTEIPFAMVINRIVLFCWICAVAIKVSCEKQKVGAIQSFGRELS